MFTVVIPAYNEAGRIVPTLEHLTRELEFRALPYEVLVVDDANDETAQLVTRFGKSRNPRVHSAHFTQRLGKGAALVEGLKLAHGDVVLYDADAATPASEIPKILAGLQHTELAIGSRYLPDSRAEGITPFRRLASRVFNLLVRILFGLNYADTQCGFKAVRADVVPNLLAAPFKSRGWEWDIELLHRARSLGLSVTEVPIVWRHVPGGPLESEGLLSVFHTGWRMFKGLLRLRLEV